MYSLLTIDLKLAYSALARISLPSTKKLRYPTRKLAAGVARNQGS